MRAEVVRWTNQSLGVILCMGKWWLVVILITPQTNGVKVVDWGTDPEGIERFDTHLKCDIAAADWNRRAEDWLVRSQLNRGTVMECITEEEASRKEWWPRRLELPFTPKF